MTTHPCRFCHTAIDVVAQRFADLGSAPPSNAFRLEDDLATPEVRVPLRTVVCPTCRLVQVVEAPSHDALFTADYVYHSSVAASWLAHARQYVATTVERLGLTTQSLVVEVASNDGYLLQYVRERGIRCLGIEPTASTAQVARARGVETVELFLGRETAAAVVSTCGPADLVVANNVLAHVPDLRDFVAGIATLTAPHGTITFEFPHLLRLVAESQFDTIYHEHFSYLSLHVVEQVLASAGLMVWDVEQLATHGGSLRVWAQHATCDRASTPRLEALRDMERDAGVAHDAFYRTLQPQAERIRDEALAFLRECRANGKRVVGYGAAAKGNTFLNFAAIGRELLPWVADASPHKQGRFLPGSGIPVVPPERLLAERPDYVLLLPWNLADEFTKSLAYVRDWGGQFVTAIPELRIR